MNCNVAGYEINIQRRSVLFLYTNKLSEKVIKKTTSFTIASKTINHLSDKVLISNILIYKKQIKLNSKKQANKTKPLKNGQRT